MVYKVYANQLKNEYLEFGFRISFPKTCGLFWMSIHFWKYEWYLSIEDARPEKEYHFEVELED